MVPYHRHPNNPPFVPVHGVETANVLYDTELYAFTGCRRCKTPGMQAYIYTSRAREQRRYGAL